MRQFLRRALSAHSYFSVDVVDPERDGDDGALTIVAFQLLSVESRSILVSTHLDRIAETLLVGATVQRMETWRDLIGNRISLLITLCCLKVEGGSKSGNGTDGRPSPMPIGEAFLRLKLVGF